MDTYSSLRNRKNRSTPALKVLKRASKSFEALQQGFIICLLNKLGFGFVIKKPERRSVKTIQSLVVNSILHPRGYVIAFEDELEKYCNQLAQNELYKVNYFALTPQILDSIAEINRVSCEGYDTELLKQIKRHREANRNSIAFNWLVKYAEDAGYVFGKRVSKPAQFTTKMIKIQSLLGESSNVEMNQDVIEYVGIKFNQYVFQQFEKEEQQLTINGNNEFILGLLNNTDEVKGTFLKSMYENELNEANGMSTVGCETNKNNNENESNEKEDDSDMKCDENDNNDTPSKTITTMNYGEQTIEMSPQENEMNQSNVSNNVGNTVLMVEQENEMIMGLPVVEMKQNEMMNEEDEPMEQEECARSTLNESASKDQVQDNSNDDEMLQQIREYYARLSTEPYFGGGFIQNGWDYY